MRLLEFLVDIDTVKASCLETSFGEETSKVSEFDLLSEAIDWCKQVEVGGSNMEDEFPYAILEPLHLILRNLHPMRIKFLNFQRDY